MAISPVSFNNTPQAVDDSFSAALTGLTEDSTNTILLAVMANDLGGQAKTLYSLDDGIENEGSATSADLLVKDIVGVNNLSQYGATIAIRADGKVAYSMTAASRAHFASLGEGEIGHDTFTYAIRLGNGTLSWATATVEIKGVNDAAQISGATNAAVAEDDAPNTTSGTLSSSDVDNSDNVFQASSGNGDNGYGSFAVDAAGNWTYTLNNGNPAVDALNVGDSLSDSFTVLSEDGTTQLVSITINGTNDAAIISGDTGGAIAEDDAPNTTSGSLSASDVDNPDNLFQANNGNADNGYGSFAVDAAGNWTYTLDNGNPAVDALNVGDSLSDSFTVLAEDGTAQLISITINGSNDAAVLSSDSVELDESNAPLSTSGQLTISDVDSDATFVAQPGTAGSYGTFSIDAAGAWSYTAASAFDALNVDDSLVDTFSVFSADGTETEVSVTINGTNDAAVLSSDSVELNETNAPLSTSGQLTISDVDSAETFVAQPGTAGSYGTFSIDAAGAWSYTADSAFDALNVGDSLVDTFSVFSADGTETEVNVTINGTNDAAVLSSDSVELNESNAPLSTSGQLTISDVDSPATFQPQTGTVGSHGSFSIDAAGAWSYTAASAFDELNVGDSLIDSFSVFSADGTETEVSVTINGTNDAAVLSSDSVELNESNAPLSTSGQLTISDVDSPATFQPQTGTVGSHGSFSIDAAGAWSYTADSAFDELNIGDSLTDTFSVFSADGTETEVSVTINGTNDAAVLSSDSVELNESNAPLSTSGQLTISDVDSDETFQPQTGTVGSYGSFSIDAAGAWSYTAASAFDELNVGDSLTDSFSVFSADGTETEVSVTINGTNDAAVLSSDSVELNETNAPLSTSGQLTISDVDSPATFQAQSNTAGSHGSFSIDAAGAWSYTADSAFDALNVGDSLVDTFSVFSADGTETEVSVTINGTNDVAVLSSDSVELNESNTPLSTSGQLSISDVDSPATFQAQTDTAGSYGSFSIDAAGAWSYTAASAFDELNVGDSLTDTFSVFSADGTETEVSVTINGTNDAAVLSSDSVELNESNAPLSTSGQLTISDVDSPATFQPQSNTAGSYGTFSIDAAGAWSYTAASAFDALNVGDSLTDTFSVFSADGTETEVSITINGTNDAAVLSSDSVELDETNAPLSTSGQLTISDVDSPATFQAQSNTAGSHGSFSIDAAGAWSYTADSAFGALNVGDSLIDSFSVFSADGTETEVSITINGTNDAAVISGDVSDTVTEDDAPNTATGTLSASDVDNDDNLFQANSGNGNNSYGSFAVDAAGSWTYTLDNGNPAVNALNAGDSLSDSFTVLSADGTAQLVSITINGTSSAPQVNATGTLSYSENQAASVINSSLTVADTDSPNLSGAQVSLSGNFHAGEDVLGFSNQNGITGSYNAVTGVLTLSGTASVANYQEALRSVTYFNASESPSGDTRTISFQVDDGALLSNIATSSVAVTPVDDGPSIIANSQVNYSTSNSPEVAFISGFSFQDADSGSNTVTVTINSNIVGDALNVLAGSGVTVAGAGTSVLTLTGMIEDINAFISSDHIKWNPLGNNTSPSQDFTISIDDNGVLAGGNLASRTLRYAFTQTNSLGLDNNVNLVSFAGWSLNALSASAGNGSDTITTTWHNGPSATAVSYVGGQPTSTPGDSITLAFTAGQLEEVLGNTTFRAALAGYLDGTPSGATLNLDTASWNATVSGFESANLALASGNDGIVTYAAVGSTLPSFLAGLTGNAGDNLLVGTAAGENLSGSSGNDILVGLDGNDLLLGGIGADLLLGGAGNDELTGGTGNDILAGGNGADSFEFGETGALNVDAVIDYSYVEGDTLDLSALLDSNFDFGAGSQVADFVQLVQAGSSITVQVDTDGAANGASFADVAVLTNYGTSGSDLVNTWFGNVEQTLTV